MIGKTAAVVPVIGPAQLSTVVGAVNVTLQSPLTSAKTGADGAIASSISTFWFAVVIFPFPSSNLQVTIVVP
ncbi:hypothetical protein D3C87_985750 [compost metagenome]